MILNNHQLNKFANGTLHGETHRLSISPLLSNFHTVPWNSFNSILFTSVRKVWPFLCRFSQEIQKLNGIKFKSLVPNFNHIGQNLELKTRNSFTLLSTEWLWQHLLQGNSHSLTEVWWTLLYRCLPKQNYKCNEIKTGKIPVMSVSKLFPSLHGLLRI
jgi:hypothetical protein